MQHRNGMTEHSGRSVHAHADRRPMISVTASGGTTALLARLIAKGTSRPLEVSPLGIARSEWECGRDREVIAASGLRMTPRDLARIGVMVLDGGRSQERQLVSEKWLATSFTPAVSMPDGSRYGYQWYLGAVPRDDGTGGARREETVSAMGNGGQRLFLLPQLGLAVVTTAGNYDVPDQWRPPMVMLRDVLLPALRAG
jgi:CubicO group peptidase (beta-lactamase class C family)